MKALISTLLLFGSSALMAQECGNVNACNYNSNYDSQTVNECVFPIGCSNPTAINYVSGVACENEESCLFLDPCGITRNLEGDYAGFTEAFEASNWVLDDNGGDGKGYVNVAQLSLYPDAVNGTPVQMYMTWFGPGGTITFDFEYFRVPSNVPPSGTIAQYIENGISNDLLGTTDFGLRKETVEVTIEPNGIFGFELPSDYLSFCEGPLRVYNLRFAELECASGCTYAEANNYNELASVDDGSCLVEGVGCLGDMDGDQQVTSSDLLFFLGVFNTDCL